MSEIKPGTRATQSVLDHHLNAFPQGIEELLKDYDESSALVTPDKTFKGRKEIEGFFQAFLDGADPAFWPAFRITSMSTVGEVAYLVWEAKPFVPMATDTLYVRDGKIAVQTFTAFSA
ncbi:nuclear transport factor 2 family protein [Paracidovorax citrulli]|uniref:Nuclear transport factor 2 family protein n=2 Tax=Paracidovorax citrulli TaxID=80869 RepID=A1TU72_PARC0|nr:nuclear transport factor 2 family protein [Paracidovorax citrulli]ABM34510.1 conserved hypothetical protein [Paracidovorax citrulli AAC00-1]ATG93968.1 nuclear transport factor 2 family protein [Paracidovorax citrulli]MVT37260.1 nuclear transport factor 2 family protein [Paracidovorax citrulli]PVY63950.1 hypothetical protein C8E08_1256 [Paracidovorax citrulli]QCX09920.1 hypothetical protein APS58_1006 [Paracidovorax citrulli]